MSEGGERVAFLVAGVQKAGTTALFQHLARDLAVSLPRLKEPHLFDDESVDWSDPDFGPYHALFDPVRPGPRGEATPIYLYWPNSLERIRTYNPAMRLILIFRDPVERAWSGWRMMVALGHEPAPFGWAIREGRARLAEDSVTPGFHRHFSYVERGFYGRQLSHALSLFDRRQLLLLRAEDLQRRPFEVVSEVADFLGVAPPTTDRGPILAHVGPREGEATLGRADRAYLQALYRDDLQRFQSLSGLDVAHWSPLGGAQASPG